MYEPNDCKMALKHEDSLILPNLQLIPIPAAQHTRYGTDDVITVM